MLATEELALQLRARLREAGYSRDAARHIASALAHASAVVGVDPLSLDPDELASLLLNRLNYAYNSAIRAVRGLIILQNGGRRPRWITLTEEGVVVRW